MLWGLSCVLLVILKDVEYIHIFTIFLQVPGDESWLSSSSCHRWWWVYRVKIVTVCFFRSRNTSHFLESKPPPLSAGDPEPAAAYLCGITCADSHQREINERGRRSDRQLSPRRHPQSAAGLRKPSDCWEAVRSCSPSGDLIDFHPRLVSSSGGVCLQISAQTQWENKYCTFSPEDTFVFRCFSTLTRGKCTSSYPLVTF